jgi:ubiquinone/menaquinone biosynthesis C-methylase UbiE
MLRRHGATRVVGVDVSEGMIALAREEEAREPLGVQYVKSAVEELGLSEHSTWSARYTCSTTLRRGRI